MRSVPLQEWGERFQQKLKPMKILEHPYEIALLFFVAFVIWLVLKINEKK